MQNVSMVGKDGERPMSVLDRQCPLSDTTPLRLLGQDKDPSQERTLVPITAYDKERSFSQMDEGPDWTRSPPNDYQERQFNMD